MRLLAIGMDGASLGFLEELMSDGRLPYFEELVHEGVTGELETAIPTETPVAIRSIRSGTNPGKIGISGF